MPHQKFGEYLHDKGVISQRTLSQLLQVLENSEERYNSILFQSDHYHYLNEERLVGALANLMSVTLINPDDIQIDPDAVNLIDADYAEEHDLIPLALTNYEMDLLMAVTRPLPDDVAEHIKKTTFKNPRPVLMSPPDFVELYNKVYPNKQRVLFKQRREHPEEISETIRTVNRILVSAIKERATDIHLEPAPTHTRIRYRIDGVLHETGEVPPMLTHSVTSRIKVLANLDITLRHTTQEGSFLFEHDELNRPPINIRVSFVPCMFGEKAVLRILPPEQEAFQLSELGMSVETLQQFREVVEIPHGVFLVTGPAASGKSTTLYSVLNELREQEVNISTVEDPVEMVMSGVNQVQLDAVNKLTFSSALKSFLRQDPDVIMIGEIRDAETARLVMQAGLTGHLVLSTMHTNDAVSAFTRLIEMDCEPYLVASSIRAVLAQRLIRTVCRHCRHERPPKAHELKAFQLDNVKLDKVSEGRGCDACRGTGYSGRTGIFELLLMDDELRKIVTHGMKFEDFDRYNPAEHLHPLRQDGLYKVKAGITTPEEVMHTTLFW